VVVVAAHATDSRTDHASWRPRPFGLLLIGLADFVGAVGLGNLFFGQSAALWLVGAAALLLAGIAASD
jgi:hypothetical protein